MFPIRPSNIRRVSFASKLFPRINSAIGLEASRKLRSSDQFDGEEFCGGRSKNKDLFTFFGLIQESDATASFVHLPLFRRALRKLTDLIEHELELIGGQEVLMPTLVPQRLWVQSERLKRQPNALDHVYTLTDNKENKLLLGPTFEESVTKLVASFESLSEVELPVILYQSSTKFRHEPNPRFGLVRTNEFLMNDTYSFDANLEKATHTYQMISRVYDKIFKRLGLPFLRISSDTGNIGGQYSHEYQVPVSSGEDTTVICDDCNKAYNIELLKENKKTQSHACIECGSTNTTKSRTLELGHTFLLANTYSKPLRAKFTSNEGRRHLEMGCYGLGLTRILAAGADLMSIIPKDDPEDLLQLRWPNEVEPFSLGIITPAKRSKQYQGGSSAFIERIVTNILDRNDKLDIIVEDRDKDGILQRLMKLQSLGIPNIVTVGQRFLQESPEVELLKLDPAKKRYEQHWFSEDQLYDHFSLIV